MQIKNEQKILSARNQTILFDNSVYNKLITFLKEISESDEFFKQVYCNISSN